MTITSRLAGRIPPTKEVRRIIRNSVDPRRSTGIVVGMMHAAGARSEAELLDRNVGVCELNVRTLEEPSGAGAPPCPG